MLDKSTRPLLSAVTLSQHSLKASDNTEKTSGRPCVTPEVTQTHHRERDNDVTLFWLQEKSTFGGKRASRLTGLKLLTSHLPKEDGAEQEDGVQEQEAQAQPAIQPPVVQVNTQHLKAGA